MMETLGTLSGPEFLTVYLVWFVVLWGGVLILRRCGFDSPLTTLGGLALFEGLGVLRFIAGSEHGMQRWGFMALMMGVGALFFLIRMGSFGGGNGSSGCSGFSCGGAGFIAGGVSDGGVSSCSSGSDSGGGDGGGSSCGGGGCGGCGGS